MRVAAVTLGGLAAGLLINLSGLASVRFLLGPDYVEGLLAHVPQPTGPGTLVRHLSVRFGLGILCVLLYLALRSNFDRAAAAAVAAGGILFLAGYVPLSLMLNEFGILVGWRLWATLLWSAGEVVAATLLGSYLCEKLGG